MGKRLRRSYLLLFAAFAAITLLLLVIGGVSGRAGQALPAAERCEPARTSGSSHTAGAGGLMLASGLDAMTDESDLVLVGTVRQLQSCLVEGGSVVTLVSIAPEQWLKGDGALVGLEPWVTLTIRGGVFGRYRLAVGTSPEFTVGERAVLFLRDEARQGIYPTQGFQSKLSVTADEIVAGSDLPLRDLWEVVRRASQGELSRGEDPLDSGLAIVESAFTTLAAKWDTSDVPVSVFINADDGRPAQLTAQEVQQASTSAFTSWEAVADSFIAFDGPNSTSRVSGADGCVSADGFNDTSWGISGGHGSNTLAVTISCFDTITDTLVDVDVEIDTDHVGGEWRVDGSGACASGLFDLETVLLHEYGHLIGLRSPVRRSLYTW